MIGVVARTLRRLSAAAAGAAAVEFALIIPVLAAMAVGVMQYGGLVLAYQQMHNGIASGAVYVMRGGSDATAIHDITVGGWPHRPSDGVVVVVQACSCAGVSASCTTLCVDGTYPKHFTTISATGTYTGPFATQSMAATQVVRTQ